MMQQTLMLNYQRFLNFLGFARSFLIRSNPLMRAKAELVAMLKDFFTMAKKKKMAQYRVNYQRYRLEQMERLIAENNEHVFLRGNKFNEMR